MSGPNRHGRSRPPTDLVEDETPDTPHVTGRPVIDERGQTVWQWQVQTGQFDLNADTQRVRVLTQSDLALQESLSAPDTTTSTGKDGGFSPYGSHDLSTAPARGNNPSVSDRSSAAASTKDRPTFGTTHRPAPGPDPYGGFNPYDTGGKPVNKPKR